MDEQNLTQPNIALESTASKAMRIILELVPESDEISPALINETGEAIVDTLQREGYDLRPVYTGTRGGPIIVEVVNAVEQAASYAWIHRALIEEALNDASALVTIMGTAMPLIRRILHIHDAQSVIDEVQTHPIKASITIDGASIEIEAETADQVDAVLAATRKYITAHPQVARQVNAKSKTTVQGRIQGKPRRRRK